MFEAYEQLVENDNHLEQDYQDLNESIMVFLPKVPVDTTEFGLEVYEPDGTRPTQSV